MSLRTLATLIVLTTVIPHAIAQNPRVFPRRFEKQFGGSVWSGLYEKEIAQVNMPTVWQTFFATGPSDGGPVGSLAFRPIPGDRGLNYFASPEFFVDLELYFGHSSQVIGREHYDIRKNRGKDFTQVVSRKKIRFPPLAAQKGSQLRPFHFRIPFDRKFVLKPSATGMFELHLHSSTLSLTRNQAVTGGAMLDAGGIGPLNTDPKYLVKDFGRHCPGPFDNHILMLRPVAMGSTVNIIKDSTGARQPKSFSFAYMGASKSNWGNLKLPFDMTPLGAPGCELVISLDFPLQQRWHIWPEDLTLWRLEVPVIPSLSGKTVYFQAVAFFQQNALGIGMSQGLEAKIGPVFPSVISTAFVRPQTMPYDADNASFGGPIFELR